MNDKLLSIKEFEFITSNESYAETGDNAHYLKERYFKELDAFILPILILILKILSEYKKLAEKNTEESHFFLFT